MKSNLFAKYSRINILVTICIFLIGSLAFYFTLNYVQLKQIDGDLKIEEEEIVLYVKQYDQLPKTYSVDDQIIQFSPGNEPFTKRYFTRKEIKTNKGHEENYRQLIFGIRAGNQWYKVTVSKSLKESDELIQSILWVTSSTILLILLSSFIINRFILKRLWKPFYTTLELLKDFKIDKDHKLIFPSTSTEEFGLMIDTLEQTTQKAQTDYLSLKSFSENASHEIQTPIAVIQSKLDLLIQDEAFSEKQSKNLQTIYKAIQRLSRLNTSLLLLTKIENNQFAHIQPIDLKSKLEEKISDFNELWQSQQIDIRYSLEECIVSINKELADILINNLLSNATKHNINHGYIVLNLNKYQLEVINTSKEPELDKSKIFRRFYKPSQSMDDNGLGLSIIKQICDVSGFIPDYHYEDGNHSFTINLLHS